MTMHEKLRVFKHLLIARRRRIGAALALILGASIFCYSALSWDKDHQKESITPIPLHPPKRDPLLGFKGVSLSQDARLDEQLPGGRFIVPLNNNERAILTWDPRMQKAAKALFAKYTVPEASLVAIEPHTGKVITYVSYAHGNDRVPDFVMSANAPAASIFKTITSAALLEEGVVPKTSECFHSGMHRLDETDIENHPEKDTRCASLSEALGGSINAVFAKLSLRYLSQKKLEKMAYAFGFNRELGIEVPAQVSLANIPDEKASRLEFARASAGFWHSTLSPLHGAIIAATVANDGEMVAPYTVQSIEDSAGHAIYQSGVKQVTRIISQPHARSLALMMERTVTEGTSRSAFYGPGKRGNMPYLGDIRVAGKTGSLDNPNPYKAFSWWIGFAPLEKPRVAIAVLIVNGPKWIIKSSFAAREFLRVFFADKKTHRTSP